MNVRAVLALIAVSVSWPAQADPVELSAFLALARPTPTTVLDYGTVAAQAVDIFLPHGQGPHPVAILIHGGCWMNLPGAGREQLRHLGAELARQGIAVWSIGYRRADEEGGGYPGTYQDVGLAIDRLRSEADRYRFDLSRTVIVGHSAGGHLALWAAARDRLAPNSRLSSAKPFIPGSVISLAGVGDLEAFARFVPILCGPGIIEKLVPADAANGYAEISPAALPPPRANVVMVSGVLDRLIPPYVAHDYVRAMRKQGKPVHAVDISGAGHFDLVTPGTPAWDEVITQIKVALGIAP